MITNLKLKMLQEVGPQKQNKLAHELGINQARMSQYMTGTRTIPAHHLLVLARYFQCPTTDLIGYTDIPRVS